MVIWRGVWVIITTGREQILFGGPSTNRGRIFLIWGGGWARPLVMGMWGTKYDMYAPNARICFKLRISPICEHSSPPRIHSNHCLSKSWVVSSITLVSHDIRLLQKLPGDFDQEYLTVLAQRFLQSCSKHIQIRLCSFTINARLIYVLASFHPIREVLESFSYIQNSFISNPCVSKEAMRLQSLRKCYTSI